MQLEKSPCSFLVLPPLVLSLISQPNNLSFGVDGKEGGSLDGIQQETASWIADTVCDKHPPLEKQGWVGKAS